MIIYINPEFLEVRSWCCWEELAVCDCSCMSIRLLLLPDIPIPCMDCIPIAPASEAVRERLPRWEEEDTPPTAEIEAESTPPSGRIEVLNLLTISSSWCLLPVAEAEEEDCREVKNFNRSRIFGFSLNCGMRRGENPCQIPGEWCLCVSTKEISNECVFEMVKQVADFVLMHKFDACLGELCQFIH